MYELLLKDREPRRDTIVVERDKAVDVVERFNALRNEWALYNQAQQSLTGATNKLDLVKAREAERASLREKVQFLTGLTPSYELYKQLSDKQATLKTFENGTFRCKKRCRCRNST